MAVKSANYCQLMKREGRCSESVAFAHWSCWERFDTGLPRGAEYVGTRRPWLLSGKRAVT